MPKSKTSPKPVSHPTLGDGFLCYLQLRDSHFSPPLRQFMEWDFVLIGGSDL